MDRRAITRAADDMETLQEIARGLGKTMQCNCDLDNWQPEPDTGHSWVCRIHKAAKAVFLNEQVSKMPEHCSAWTKDGCRNGFPTNGGCFSSKCRVCGQYGNTIPPCQKEDLKWGHLFIDPETGMPWKLQNNVH